MTPPAGNGTSPERRLSPGPPEPGGVNDLVAEAEALRHLLAEAAARAGRLVAALKQHRREARAVRAAVASLRQMGLGG
jgi:hypothetical protein